ncbi:MAG: tRNA (guanosine(46)-N7)-methyltransferase TrmB [Muribaculaceae bacterium]|nr:tRNA (guanosine(46)-N7)-methyltransferase TrmB [Muribaculaceae bacterium]
MGKNKLQKFSDMETFGCVLQYPRHILIEQGFPFKGKWNSDFFSRSNPITVELGCGKGEYTVGLAAANHDRNYVGVDIKGARMWKGAKAVEENGMDNAAFLRTEIEQIEQFFAPGEVDEIWITFPDPQMQKARKRLTSSRFLSNYRKFLRPGGVVNLKTDSPFLFEYTKRLVKLNGFDVLAVTDDLYGSGLADPVTSIKTFYEQQWLSRGKTIKLLSFRIGEGDIEEPDCSDLEKDDYHSEFGRHSSKNA